MARGRKRKTNYDPSKHDAESVIQAAVEKTEGKVSEGLGDTVEKVFKATGIDKAAKFILGEDCGCAERKALLNKYFPYRRPQCLTEQEYEYLHAFYQTKPREVAQSQKQPLLDIYNRVFRTGLKPTGCADCWRDIVKQLKRVYDTYENTNN